MEGDKWKVKQDCNTQNIYLKAGNILIEKRGYNFDTECREECGDYNELHNDSGFVCDVGSKFAKDNLKLEVIGERRIDKI